MIRQASAQLPVQYFSRNCKPAHHFVVSLVLVDQAGDVRRICRPQLVGRCLRLVAPAEVEIWQPRAAMLQPNSICRCRFAGRFQGRRPCLRSADRVAASAPCSGLYRRRLGRVSGAANGAQRSVQVGKRHGIAAGICALWLAAAAETKAAESEAEAAAAGCIGCATALWLTGLWRHCRDWCLLLDGHLPLVAVTLSSARLRRLLLGLEAEGPPAAGCCAALGCGAAQQEQRAVWDTAPDLQLSAGRVDLPYL